MPNDNIIRLAALQDSGEISARAEDSIALEFAERHANELRYVAAWGQGFSFDGSRWVRDSTLHAFDCARAICREVAAGQKAAMACTVASAKTVAAVERLAKADRRLAAEASQWDADGWLLNTGDEDK